MPGGLGQQYQLYKSRGGTLTYNEWVNAGMPAGPTTEEPPSNGDGDELTDAELRQRRYDLYVSRGGTLGYTAWIQADEPSHPEAEEVFDDEPPPDEPPPDEPPPDEPPPVEPGEEDFSQQLAAAVAGYERQIAEATALQRAEAQRLGARDIGKMSRMQQQGLLARGRSAGEIEQLMAGGQEAGARSLNDLLQALNVSERQQLAGAKQFGIGTMISGEELGIRQRQIAHQMAQYQQSFAEQRRQFGVGAGFTQQQLAQQQQYQQGQLGLGREQAQASLWGPLFGALGTIGGGALGSIFGPAGTAIGSALGTWVGPGGGGWFGGRV